MALNRDGVLLEGIRLANANNVFNFPPRNLVTDSSAFNSVVNRAEYVILAGASDNSVKATDIGDSRLRFNWTRNEGSVSRFTYDGFAQKWLPSPGAPPDVLGPLSNTPRLTAPIPDTSVTDAPFKLFLGSTSRILTFAIQIVGTAGDFTNPITGTVQLALDSGLLNFGSDDISTFGGQDVLSQRQSFFDRIQFKGLIGVLPSSSSVDYFIHLNPLPGSGQIPRIRIDYQRYLAPVQVSSESGLSGATAGTFRWASDTGRIKFADSDIDANAGRSVYYDGVHNSSVQLSRTTLGTLSAAWPSVGFTSSTLIGATDPVQYLVFAELGSVRSYFPARLITTATAPSREPVAKECFVNTDTGQVFFNASDVSAFASWTFCFVNTIVQIDKGVSVQFYRSAVNTSGLPVVDDFTIIYFTEDQLLVDGIGQFPFIQLPTTPVVDSELEYVVAPGPSSSGTFSGALEDATDSSAQGLGYTLNLDVKQLQFSNRKTVSKEVLVPTPVVKLDDGIINPFGFVVDKNGIALSPGVDFAFDPITGEMEFLESVGGNDPNNEFDITGTVVLPNSFVPDEFGVFDTPDIGKYLLVSSLPNVGAYRIDQVFSNRPEVSPDFLAAGSLTVDVRAQGEIIADNFWQVLAAPFRKIVVGVGSSLTGPFSEISGFTAFPTTGQINLAAPAEPGSIYHIEYEYLRSLDDGSTVSTLATDTSLFRVRQEAGITTVGSSTVLFNPDGRLVSLARPIEVYVNGITQGPETFQFQSPGTIFLQQPVTAGQIVTINYWVNDAVGGETGFQLLNSPLVVDNIRITPGSTSVILNGDYSSTISSGCVILVDLLSEIVVIASVTYASSTDTTVLEFESPAAFDSGNNGTFHVSSSSIYPEQVIESSSFLGAVNNSTTMSFVGDVSGYREGTVITLDDDSYLVVSSIFVQATNRTEVAVAVRFRRNYITSVLKRSARPVFFPSSKFQTSKLANVGEEFILVRMGDSRKILVRGADYTVSEGGAIDLSFVAGGTDSLICMYVANKLQSIGDVFGLNYSYAISPSTLNGIAGQRLLSTYNLFSPDCFFYRIETVGTFLPEVQDLLRQSSQASGVSGPNTRDAVGRTNKDEGSPSPYFPEQHLANLDFSITQLLKFYNDLVNLYEDLLSNMDGRIVGGEHGRFRFDGISNNPARDTYADVTNDLDDRIVLYYRKVLTGFFTFSDVPVYVSMSQPNAKSRVYPISNRVSAAINNLVGASNNGQVLGTLGIEAITSASNFISTPAAAFSTVVFHVGAQTAILFEENGDFEHLVPKFVAGMQVTLYSNDGVEDVTTTVASAAVNSVTINATTTLESGYIARNTSDPDDTTVSRYKTGFDIGLNTDTGEIVNISNASGAGNPQEDIVGNEILDVTVQFNNQETTPRRIPALDGSLLNDYGFFSVPQMRRNGETILLEKEKLHIGNMNISVIDSSNLSRVSTPIFAVVNDIIRFIDGPNAGAQRAVQSVISIGATSVYQMASAFAFADPGSNSERLLADGTRLDTTLGQEIGVMETNVAGVASGNLFSVDSELITAGSIIDCIGIELSSGTGQPTSATVFSDPTANFSLDGVGSNSFLYVSSGANLGLYKVVSATATQLVVDNGALFAGFPSSGVAGSYSVFDVESILTDAGPEFLTEFLRETVTFLSGTLAWRSAPTTIGKTARTSSIDARIADIDSLISSIENILQRADQLYDVRYLWIQQRADRKTGLLTQRNQAILKRQEDLVRIVSDQKKLLITESL